MALSEIEVKKLVDYGYVTNVDIANQLYNTGMFEVEGGVKLSRKISGKTWGVGWDKTQYPDSPEYVYILADDELVKIEPVNDVFEVELDKIPSSLDLKLYNEDLEVYPYFVTVTLKDRETDEEGESIECPCYIQSIDNMCFTGNLTSMQSLFDIDCSMYEWDNTAEWYSKDYKSWPDDNYISEVPTLTSHNILNVKDLDTSNATNMSNLFSGRTLITYLDVSNFDTSKVTDMNYMFCDCCNLTSLDLSNFDTSKVTNMSDMFCGCSSLTTLDLSNFDTSKVIDMDFMFDNCYNLTSLDLSNFDTSKVTDMSGMFCGCSSLTTLDLSNFDTSKVIDMDFMFDSCYNLTSLDLSNFDTSKVTNMSDIFYDCSSLTSLDLSGWDISNVSCVSNMFFGCTSLTSVNVSGCSDSTKTVIQNALQTLGSWTLVNDKLIKQ